MLWFRIAIGAPAETLLDVCQGIADDLGEDGFGLQGHAFVHSSACMLCFNQY